MAFRDICKQKLRKNYGKTAKNRVFKLKIQLPSKQWVVGSIPARGAIFYLKNDSNAIFRNFMKIPVSRHELRKNYGNFPERIPYHFEAK